MAKPEAATLLDEQFNRPSWQPQTVMMSGDTDCYQPIEKKLQITRGCLEVFLHHRNPVSVVTKNALIQRDLDILKELAALNLVAVTISITSLDHDLIRRMEPRTSIPEKRLETIRVLSDRGIPVAVNACPIIPGLNDVEIPSILEESSSHGARTAGYSVVRLPYAVKDLFVDWLQRELPNRASTVLNRIRDIRRGNLTCSDFGVRLNGEGQIAEAIEQLFQSSCRRFHLNEAAVSLSTSQFRRIHPAQPELF
jgi:DNA repair photolyase